MPTDPPVKLAYDSCAVMPSPGEDMDPLLQRATQALSAAHSAQPDRQSTDFLSDDPQPFSATSYLTRQNRSVQ